MTNYAVAEKFLSINGEGLFAGLPAAFIRFRGCNLRCSYCDTAWAQTESCPAEIMNETEILDYIRSTSAVCCTLTGGEPVLRDGFDGLCRLLLTEDGLRTEIETNGSADLKALAELRRCNEDKLSFTMDWKLPSSGMESKMLDSNFDCLTLTDSVKFVCGSYDDLIRAREIIVKYGLYGKCQTIFSGVYGKIRPDEIVQFILDNRLNKSRFQLQLHKFIWDPEKRGV